MATGMTFATPSFTTSALAELEEAEGVFMTDDGEYVDFADSDNDPLRDPSSPCYMAPRFGT